MNVKFFATYRMIVGQGCINLPAPRDVLELLEILEQRYPDFQGLLLNDDHTDKGRDAIVLVCGRHIEHLDGVRTPLSEQDYVAMTPLVARGLCRNVRRTPSTRPSKTRRRLLWFLTKKSSKSCSLILPSAAMRWPPCRICSMLSTISPRKVFIAWLNT